MKADEGLVGESVERYVIVNGDARRISAGSLELALIELGYSPDSAGIALAHNGRIVHRGQWSSVSIDDDDVIDIVGAVQGG